MMLLDSLLSIGVEEKSFEIGIIRMNGESKVGSIMMIIIRSLMFALPAVIFSILISIPFL